MYEVMVFILVLLILYWLFEEAPKDNTTPVLSILLLISMHTEQVWLFLLTQGIITATIFIQVMNEIKRNRKEKERLAKTPLTIYVIDYRCTEEDKKRE